MYEPDTRDEIDDRAVDKITRRYAGLKPGETALRLREDFWMEIRREVLNQFIRNDSAA